MSRWRRLGVIHAASPAHGVCSLVHPTPVLLNCHTLRIYVTLIDSEGTGRIGYIDVDPGHPLTVIRVSPVPVLDVGLPGTFDDGGVYPSSIVLFNERVLHLYYTGLERGHTSPNRLLAGMAASHDGGESFTRIRTTPLLERSEAELYLRAFPYVLKQYDGYRMWYVAAHAWTEGEGGFNPVSEIRRLHSPDGVRWGESGTPCILAPSPLPETSLWRPCIAASDDRLIMHFSIRSRGSPGLVLESAVSEDGVHWERVSDEKTSVHGLNFAVVTAGDRTYAFYNEDERGDLGISAAVLEQE